MLCKIYRTTFELNHNKKLRRVINLTPALLAVHKIFCIAYNSAVSLAY